MTPIHCARRRKEDWGDPCWTEIFPFQAESWAQLDLYYFGQTQINIEKISSKYIICLIGPNEIYIVLDRHKSLKEIYPNTNHWKKYILYMSNIISVYRQFRKPFTIFFFYCPFLIWWGRRTTVIFALLPQIHYCHHHHRSHHHHHQHNHHNHPRCTLWRPSHCFRCRSSVLQQKSSTSLPSSFRMSCPWLILAWWLPSSSSPSSSISSFRTSCL